ncbi:MAG: DNA repair protein radA [uncultured bacterium (gcode 4)]|uniref:DNA repair protein radA n=1 Tax=uncultured bacterium (gcode 4) TaxID=1234023 RepID=K2GG35_9BACT|nr:MAG: DNA repair protein radA [uncultured bacterium (gcode 4)]
MYRCSECWSESPKWVWKCPNCSNWNSLVEIDDNKKQSKKSVWKQKDTFKILGSSEQVVRNMLSSDELNNVLGGWIVPWSLILLSWEPWIWKSTMSLQIADWYAKKDNEVLYISSEENIFQLSWRANRLDIANQNIHILNSSNLEDISETIEKSKVELIIVDSISVIYSSDVTSSSWSISQIRYIAERLMEIAKRTQKSIILIWHVTKDGTISWPKALEHLVDTVLYLEWSKYENYRILRSLKNRFWPTDEVGLFMMTEKWLVDLKNPWMEFINKNDQWLSWSALAMTMEWNRPMLIEIEALTTYTKFWYPKRSARWINAWKLDLMIAVLTKFSDTKLESHDVYLNISRWLTIQEPWIDLAVLAAIISSKKNKPLWKIVFIWEVSLTWVIKNVFQLDRRVDEAIKLWFEKIVIPAWVYKWKKWTWIISEIKNMNDLEKLC